MSAEGPSQRYGVQRNPHPIYPYPPEDHLRRMSYQPPPSLPSMSTILSRPEHMAAEPIQTHYQPPQSYQPRYYEPPRHPLHLSEMNPAAPPQYIHHAPQENYAAQHQVAPTLVQVQPSNQTPPRPGRVAIPSLAQSRQSKKIGQRRHDPERDWLEINSSSAPQQKRPTEPQRSDSQDTTSYMKTEAETRGFEPSTQRSSPPRHATPASVPISGLLSDSSSKPQSNNSHYILSVRQQPKAARACGFGERDRRVIDPPPILQLNIEDPTATPTELSMKLRTLCLVVHVTLWDPKTDTNASTMPGTTDKRQQRRLMGTLVSSPFVGKDEFDVEGCFFTFPDLSVRTPGKYSLRFSLAVIDPMSMQLGSKAPIKSVVKSADFDVYNAKDFGGMRASSALTKRLKHQGCLISVKKGNGKANQDDDDDDDDDEMGDDEDDMTKPPAKRNKKR